MVDNTDDYSKFSMLFSRGENGKNKNIGKMAPCVGCNGVICKPETCIQLDSWLKL